MKVLRITWARPGCEAVHLDRSLEQWRGNGNTVFEVPSILDYKGDWEPELLDVLSIAGIDPDWVISVGVHVIQEVEV